jgi:protein gp37
MGAKTDIEWCDSTVNPTENCEGCELWNPKAGVRRCYAGVFTERMKGRGAFDASVIPKPGRMQEAAKWGDLANKVRDGKEWIPARLPRLVFISDMSDALSSTVQFDYLLSEIVETVRGWPHIGLWLTKRGRRLLEFDRWMANRGIAWPANLWAGVSVTGPKTLPRLRALSEVRAAVRFVSCEPLAEALTAEAIREAVGTNPTPDWAIIGGESGLGAPETPLEALEQTAAAWTFLGASVFVKQVGVLPTRNGQLVEITSGKGGALNDIPEGIRVRQFPAWSGRPTQVDFAL